MRKFIFPLILLSVLFSCERGGIAHRTRYGIEVETSTCKVELVCYTPSIIRVVKSPLSTLPVSDTSLSVTLTPEKVKFRIIEETPLGVTISTDSLIARIDLESATVRIYDIQGNGLLCEKPESFKLNPMKDAGTDSYNVVQGFILDTDEAIYGLGQHQQGGLNLRGRSIHLQNVNTEIAIPLVHSIKGYALFWDNYSTTDFSEHDGVMVFDSQVGSSCNYYFIYGGSADGVVAGIRALTGQAPMFPLWSYGYHQSRERYVSQGELTEVVRRYRELGVPLDGIIQDWRYWGEDHKDWNAVEFRNPQFPDPGEMLWQVHQMNAHCLISVWPSFGPETRIFKELEADSLLMVHETFPQNYGVRVYDCFDPRAREIYWNYMKNNMFDKGMDGWWLDATEPEHSPVKDSDYDYMTPLGSFRKLRNAFPISTVGGVYDHQRADDATKRVFILTRSATAGMQRYGANVWSGDVASGWEELRAQIPAALNYSLCGLPYWNSDIGGFNLMDRFPGGNRNPEFRKLYLRWMQFSVFSGMMRSHGTSTPREIFNFGNRGDAMFDALEKYINLRYRLLSYIYNNAWDITSSSSSQMRALFMDWPKDTNVRDMSDEYMFGKSILVAPVTDDSESRTIYLPKTTWIDFWTGGRIAGGVTFTKEAAMDVIPLYVRQGSIIPVGPSVQYAAEKPWDTLQIRIYTGADAEYTLYEDEGDNYNYESGRYSTIKFSWDDSKCELTVHPRNGSFEGMLQKREFRAVIVRCGKGTGLDNESYDISIPYTGREMKMKLD